MGVVYYFFLFFFIAEAVFEILLIIKLFQTLLKFF